MAAINAGNVIKDFILETRERFELALDIYGAFDFIIDEMLHSVLGRCIDQINEKHELKLELKKSGRQANYYWFQFNISPDFFLEFHSDYFFRTTRMLVRSNKGNQIFDPEESNQISLRNELKNEFKETSEENWYIAGIRNDIYEMNVGDSFLDLYDAFKNTDVLLQNFDAIFGEKIEKIVNIINNLKTSPK